MARLPNLALPPLFDDAIKSLERDLMRYLMRVTRDREDSLDLFQETWLRAYRAYPKLKSADGLRPWVFTIAANLCRNRIRDHVRRSRVIAADSHPPSSDSIGARTAGAGSLEGVLSMKHAIARLPSRKRDALTMRKLRGLEYDEIGAELDCSAESARATVYQALKKLRAAR